MKKLEVFDFKASEILFSGVTQLHGPRGAVIGTDEKAVAQRRFFRAGASVRLSQAIDSASFLSVLFVGRAPWVGLYQPWSS
jgi:hypothetical protein